MLLAAGLMLLLALWERGTLAVLASERTVWSKAYALLDLNTAYRVTGIFADMHTGGEVIDALLLILLPPSLAGALRTRQVWARLLCLGGFGAVCYVILVGFTRATYAAAAFATLATLLAQLAAISPRHLPRKRVLLLVCAVPLVVTGLQQWLYPMAGMKGALALAATVLGAGIAQRLHRCFRVRLATLGAVTVVGVAMAVAAHVGSSYATATPNSTVLVALCLCLTAAIAYLGSHYLAEFGNPPAVEERTGDERSATARQNRQRRRSPRRLDVDFLTALVLLALLPAGFAVALKSYGITDRLQSVGADLQTRWDHWERVIESGSGRWQALWFGNGVGTFPARYATAYPQTLADVGSFRLDREGQRLTLGVGRDLTLTQRVRVQPDTDYLIQLTLEEDTAPRLLIRLCEHNQLFFNNWPPRCVRELLGARDIRDEIPGIDLPGAHYGLRINTGKVGELPPWLRKPVDLQIANWGEQPVTLKEVRLIGGAGLLVLRNGDFGAGLDHWFFFNDQRHLPWHVKNLWLQAWYESGWLGLALLVLLVVATGLKALMARHTTPEFLFLWVSIASVMVCGAFGSPLDSARVSLWFYLLLFILAMFPRARRGLAPRFSPNRTSPR